jgi:hypothetical protein
MVGSSLGLSGNEIHHRVLSCGKFLGPPLRLKLPSLPRPIRYKETSAICSANGRHDGSGKQLREDSMTTPIAHDPKDDFHCRDVNRIYPVK